MSVASPHALQAIPPRSTLTGLISALHRKGSRHGRAAHHSASLRRVAVLRENQADLRPEEDRMDLGPDLPDHAAARSDAADRRLSAHAGDADRRRHLLRYAMHHARAGAAVSRAWPAAGWLSR